MLDTPQTDALEVIRAFTAAWERRDLDAICAAVTDDCVWGNPQSSPIIGPDAMRQTIAHNVTAAVRIDMALLNVVVAADGKTVLCERLDAVVFPEGEVPIPVMGIFEVRDGKIAAWRDYFDQGLYRQRLAAIAQAPGIDQSPA